jgi:hypothetical protein
MNSCFWAFGQVGQRYFQAQGFYSICPPLSWEIETLPGRPTIVLKEPIKEFPVEIVIVYTRQPPNLTVEKGWQEYKSLLSFDSSYKSISTANFSTNNGLSGIKHIYTRQEGRNNLRCVLYMFIANGGHSVNIECEALAQYGDRYDNIFDESVATLEIR